VPPYDGARLFLPSPTSRNHPSLPPSFAAAPVEDAFSQRPTVRSATTTSHSFSISLVRTTRHTHHSTPAFFIPHKTNTQLAHKLTNSLLIATVVTSAFISVILSVVSSFEKHNKTIICFEKKTIKFCFLKSRRLLSGRLRIQ
jgi:hypothetical protein